MNISINLFIGESSIPKYFELLKNLFSTIDSLEDKIVTIYALPYIA